MTELPTYLATVLNFSVEAGGLVGVLPWAAIAITANVGGLVVDEMKRRNVQMKLVRRVCYLIAASGTCVCFLAAAYLRSPAIVFGFIVAGTGFVGLSLPAFAPNVLEVGGEHASAVFGVINTIASIP